MPLVGKPIQPRALAKLCDEAGWRDENLVTAVAVCLSESAGYPLAYHDNIDDAGTTLSRDVGLFQINIPKSQIGTSSETDLYEPELNVARARTLFESRGWQPWYGYTNGYAMSTEWWRWSKTSQAWVASGRYLHRAIRGVANYWAESMGIRPAPMLFFDDKFIPPKPTAPPAA